MIEPDTVERCASNVVDCIRNLIDNLRIEFPIQSSTTSSSSSSSSTRKSSTCRSSSRPTQQKKDDTSEKSAELPKLFSNLVKQGMVNKVIELKSQQEKILGTMEMSSEYIDLDSKSTTSNSYVANDTTIDERICFVNEILIPLIWLLIQCYEILDKMPQPQIQQQQQQQQQEQQQSPRRNYSTSSKKKPPPPRGMLSLQNYTDIACLLELTVCTSILPHMEPYILSSLQDRLRYQLPKSLMGRIPRLSLAWGTSYHNSNNKDDDNFLINKVSTTTATTDSTSPVADSAEATSNSQDIQRMDKKLKELMETTTAISTLVLLDRFRPMLLPRHLPDLVAASLQVEHNLISETNKGENSSSSSSSLLLDQFQNSKLAHSLGFATTSTTRTRTTATKTAKRDDEKITTNTAIKTLHDHLPIDATLQARTYQTLLLQGTKGPLWVRQRVSPLLTNLACQNLPAIVQVFVPLSEPASASQRLGRVLATTAAISAASSSPSKSSAKRNTTTTNNAIASTTLRRLCRQMMIVLEAIYPSLLVDSDMNTATNSIRKNNNNNNSNSQAMIDTTRIPARAMAILQTIWSVLDHWSDEIITREIINVWGKAFDMNGSTTTNGRGSSSSSRTGGIHSVIRQIIVLFSFVPPSSLSNSSNNKNSKTASTAWTILKLLLAPKTSTATAITMTTKTNITKTETNKNAFYGIFFHLVRIATMSTGILQSIAKNDAKLALQIIIGSISLLTTKSNSNEQQGQQKQQQQQQEIVSSATSSSASTIRSNTMILMNHENSKINFFIASLICAIAPSSWDMIGNNYCTISSNNDIDNDKVSTAKKGVPSSLENIQLKRTKADNNFDDDTDMINLEMITESLSKRIELIMEITNIFSSTTDENDNDDDGIMNKHGQGGGSFSFVVSQLFRAVLIIFLYGIATVHASTSNTTNNGRGEGKTSSTKLTTQESVKEEVTILPDSFRLVAIVLLPLLCEKCSSETLLFGNANNTNDNPNNNSTNDSIGLLTLIRSVLACAATGTMKTTATTTATIVKNETTSMSRYDDNDDNGRDTTTIDLENNRADDILYFLTDMAKQGGYNQLPDLFHKDVDGNNNKSNDKQTETTETETLISISSIVLSLLISVLEVGSKQRSIQEEEVLQSCLPILHDLANFVNVGVIDDAESNGLGYSSATNTNNTNFIAATVDAGMADMAGYAMALIASRNIISKEQEEEVEQLTATATTTMTKSEKLFKLIHQAENDLQSLQPPIRARGMVSLGKLARGYLGIISTSSTSSSSSNKNDPLPSMVVEMLVQDENEKVQQQEQEQDDGTRLMNVLINEVIRLSMIALSDNESYVYLAAVQTLVAIGDIRPREVLPILSLALVSGTVQVKDRKNDNVNDDKMSTTLKTMIVTDMKLSQEQRIKLAEALMFIIRRRAATDEYVPYIVNIMVFGSKSNQRIGELSNHADVATKSTTSKQQQHQRQLQQKETHRYFLGLNNNDDEDDDINNDSKDRTSKYHDDGFFDVTTQRERWEEQDIRLKTGGPIFVSEENDIIRAVRISVLAELIATSKPSTMANHCHIFVRLPIDVLRFETSRSVRRAAALLVRELYGCILREQYDDNDHVTSNKFSSSLSTSSLVIPNKNDHHRNGNDVDGQSTLPLPLTRAFVSLNDNNNNNNQGKRSSKTAVVDDEEVLVSILQAHAFGRKGQIETTPSSDDCEMQMSKVSMIHHDPTTSIRCKEALELREEIIQIGLFTAARLLIVQEEETNNKSIFKVL